MHRVDHCHPNYIKVFEPQELGIPDAVSLEELLFLVLVVYVSVLKAESPVLVSRAMRICLRIRSE